MCFWIMLAGVLFAFFGHRPIRRIHQHDIVLLGQDINELDSIFSVHAEKLRTHVLSLGSVADELSDSLNNFHNGQLLWDRYGQISQTELVFMDNEQPKLLLSSLQLVGFSHSLLEQCFKRLPDA